MTRTLPFTTIVATSLLVVSATAHAEPPSESTESRELARWAESRDARMEWWRDARFGMFVHWGLYSPAGGFWDGKKYEQHYAEWIQHWAAVPCAEYARQMKPLFQPDAGFAEAWADLAKEAGMRYAVMTSKHHDGFTLFNSNEPYSKANDVAGGTNISPAGRDVAREFADAMRARGLKAGFYYSLLDWQHPDAYEMALPAYPKDGHARDHERYKAYMRGHVRELLTNYGPLSTIWFDYSDQARQGEAWGAAQLLSDMRDAQPSILVNNRLFFGLENKNGDYGTPEKYVPPTGLPGMDWEVNHTLNESYGYSAHDMHWKDVPTVVRLLADIVSKGGNLLLNIGPDAKGRVPEQAASTLRGVGAWMKVHGEAIYGTTASPFHRLAWGRATRKGNTLYLFIFDWPSDDMLHVPLTNAATRATLLGASSDLAIARSADLDELVISLPKQATGATLPVVRLELSDAPNVAEFAVRPDADGVIRLKPHDAELQNEGNGKRNGEGLRIEQVGAIENVQYNIGYWLDRADFPSWKVRVPSSATAKTGKDVVRYEVYLTMACADASAGSAFSLVLDGVKVDGVTRGTGDWQKYQDVFLGPVTWKPGAHSVAVKAITKPGEAVMNIREIRFVPVLK